MPSSEVEWRLLFLGMGYFVSIPNAAVALLKLACISDKQCGKCKKAKTTIYISYGVYIVGFATLVPLVYVSAKEQGYGDAWSTTLFLLGASVGIGVTVYGANIINAFYASVNSRSE